MNKQAQDTQNVKKILGRLGKALDLSSGSQLASALEISPSALGNWKSRGTADYNKIFTLCEANNIDIDWIITGKKRELAPAPQSVNTEIQEQTPQKFLAPKVVTVDKRGKDNIVLVPQKAAAGYLAGFGDPEFIGSLPTYNLPNLQNGTFRMFQVAGHSMYPTLQDGSFVVGEWVENWAGSIKDDRIYIIVSQEDGVTVKRVLNRIDKYGSLYCKSDNRREYPNFTVNPKDLVEVWEVKMHLSFELPNPAQLYDRLSDLEAEVIYLKDHLKTK